MKEKKRRVNFFLFEIRERRNFNLQTNRRTWTSFERFPELQELMEFQGCWKTMKLFDFTIIIDLFKKTNYDFFITVIILYNTREMSIILVDGTEENMGNFPVLFFFNKRKRRPTPFSILFKSRITISGIKRWSVSSLFFFGEQNENNNNNKVVRFSLDFAQSSLFFYVLSS